MTNSSILTRNVSRETFSLLERYVVLLQKWNGRINLVGKSTEKEIWQRHIEDSLQLLPLIPETIRKAADLGSGGGLPGLVLAIARPQTEFTLIEQDQRKSAFLVQAAATLGLNNVRVLTMDIRKLTDSFEVVTARALASLTELFSMAQELGDKGSIWLFPKGKNFANEVTEAEREWVFEYQLIPSLTQEYASIVSVSQLSRRKG